MEKFKQEYVIDKNGRKTKVILDMKYYIHLQKMIEDLQDALDIKKARKEKSRDYDEYLRERNKK